MSKPTPLLMQIQPPRRQPIDQAWMLTFADLTSLLLCFFILLYASLTINRTHWQALVGSFAATFAPSAVAVSVMPSGQFNAMPVSNVRRGVPYLDTILRQRVADDAVWQGLQGIEQREDSAFVYPLAPEFNDLTNPNVAAAWVRLGAAVRTWQTPMAVRVVVPAGADLTIATTRALALAQAAAQGGARVTAEVRRGTIDSTQWATQWVLYGAE